ncbi:MAG: tRNA dihydrouridine synthase DusB [Bacteroidia bacterium]|nr:MAG: tRNA dihydrouridine synthase DusB [Bacteroidia bacterium]
MTGQGLGTYDRPIRIGRIDFRQLPVVLAPMEDITDPPFRRLCKEMGADWVYTEFISADGLIRDADKSLHKLDIYPDERPVSIQIFGANPDAMVEAARIAEEAQPDFVDINFGCPVRKVASKGAGSGMMNDVPKMVGITRRIVNAVKLPVTVKTRLGYDQKHKIIVDLAERFQDCGIAALAIHGRTRCQLYRGTADWTLIGEVKNNPRMHIPIIGNGDIVDGHTARHAFEKYGVDGIMIGRAATGYPWIFREVRHYLDTGKLLPPPSLKERLTVCRRHVDMSVEWKGERTAIFEMRKHYGSYFRGLPNFKPFRMRLVNAGSREELEEVLQAVEDNR